MNLNVTEISYKEYGKCLCITDGVYELYVTLDVGPRILKFGFKNGVNEFAELGIKPVTEKETETFKPFGDLGVWQNYGGHRLWAAEEYMPRTYFPDNRPISYELTESALNLSSGVQPWTQIEASISLSLNNGIVTLNHRIKNHGAWDIKLSPWALSVMAPGGLEVVPQNSTGSIYNHNRTITLWPYTKLQDERVYFGNKYITLQQDTGVKYPFKFGCNNELGKVFYFNHGNLFIKEFDVVSGACYPDGGVNYETYTCDSFTEMESLGVFSVVKPGGEVFHKEKWRLIPDVAAPKANDEEEIEKLLKEYLH